MRNGWWGCLVASAGLLVAAAWAGGAAAADLTLSGTGIAEYDDNAFREGGDGEDDVIFRLIPTARLHEDRGQDFRYFLQYSFPVDIATRNPDLSDVDHSAGGRLTYHPNDRLELFASDSFRYLRGNVFDVAEEGDDGLTRINEERERVTLNDAQVGANYLFTPRLEGSLQAVHEYFDSDRDDRAENWLLRGIGELDYALTPRHKVGGGAMVIYQEFDEARNIVASRVTSYNVFGSWTWFVDDKTNFQIRVGPTYLQTEQDDPPSGVPLAQVPFQVGDVGDSWDGFVDVNGTPLAGDATDPFIVVPQVGACDTLPGSGENIFPCGFRRTGGPDAGVVVTDVNDIATVTGQVVAPERVAGGDDDERWNVYAQALLTRSWSPNLHTGLRYTRTQGGASGLGGAVVEDRVSLSTNWDFAERWNFFLRGDWSYRETLTEATGFVYQAQTTNPGGVFAPGVMVAGFVDGAGGILTVRGGSTSIDTMRYGVASRVTHRFTRNTSFWGQLAYNRQESQGGTLGDPSDFDDFLATIGVRHVFDPIKLW